MTEISPGTFQYGIGTLDTGCDDRAGFGSGRPFAGIPIVSRLAIQRIQAHPDIDPGK
jgi:hypothetical protein